MNRRKIINDYDKKFNQFTDQIRKYPNNIRAYLDRVELWFSLGSYSTYLTNFGVEYKYEIKLPISTGQYFPYDDLQKVIELNPTNERALLLLGISEYYRPYISTDIFVKEEVNYSKIIEIFKEIIKINPNNEFAYYGIARCYIKQNKIQKALEFFNKALKINPKYKLAYLSVGEIYYNKKNYNKAIESFLKLSDLIQHDPKYVVYRYLAKCYERISDFDNAYRYYTKCIEAFSHKDSILAVIYFERGLLYFNNKKYELALDDFKKAIEIKDNIHYRFLLSVTYYELNKIESSFKELDDIENELNRTDKYYNEEWVNSIVFFEYLPDNCSVKYLIYSSKIFLGFDKFNIDSESYIRISDYLDNIKNNKDLSEKAEKLLNKIFEEKEEKNYIKITEKLKLEFEKDESELFYSKIKQKIIENILDDFTQFLLNNSGTESDKDNLLIKSAYFMKFYSSINKILAIQYEKTRNIEKIKNQKEMLSFLTHTLRNSLSAGPETARTIASNLKYILGDKYEQNNLAYKTTNKAISLLTTFKYVDNLIDTFKLFSSNEQILNQKWKNDFQGDLQFNDLISQILIQIISKFLFYNTYNKEREQIFEYNSLKSLKKSFLDEILSDGEYSIQNKHILSWISANIQKLKLKLNYTEFKVRKDGIRFGILFSIISELIFNSFLYYDGIEDIEIKINENEQFIEFTCSNHFDSADSTNKGTNKGISFIKHIVGLIDDISFETRKEEKIWISKIKIKKDKEM